MRSALALALLAIPTVAQAHIFLMEPTSRATDAQGNPQKDAPCGGLNSMRDPAKVTTYRPGQTITLTFRETIDHTGWYRVSFQPDGQNFPIPPAGNGPPTTFPDMVAAGTVDAATNSIVLMDRIPDVAQNVDTTVQITLPNMECTNCTLQFLSIMTNAPPYDGAANGAPDLYFNCADLVLANNAPDAGVNVTSDASVDPVDPGGTDPGKVSGGCSTGHGSGLPAALALLGLASLRRRRR